nr:gonadotropin-releasing hormone-2 [Notocomplana humilis]
MNRCLTLSMLAVVLLVVLDQAIGQNMHFSNEPEVSAQSSWQPGKRAEKKKSTHDFFRVRRVYHFFRLRKSEQCIFDQAIMKTLMDRAESTSLCRRDVEFLDSLTSLARRQAGER